MISDKLSVNHLVQICEEKGIRDIIFSPGSRNAALVLAFTQSKKIESLVVPDERVAAFMALGMSIKTQKPTIICCTSGSAALNYSPAISEAYYQHVPLLVITADRPKEWIDQGVGQSIRQDNIYANFIKGSFTLIGEAQTEDALWYNARTINEAINLSIDGQAGPVHINIPFAEPLYNQVEEKNFIKANVFTSVSLEQNIAHDDLKALAEKWSGSRRKIILMGHAQHNPRLENLLSQLVSKNDVVLLSETCSNIDIANHIQCIDRVITTFEGKESMIQADLLISIGGPVISKKVKHLFNKVKPLHHWYVGEGPPLDSYQSLDLHVQSNPVTLLKALVTLDSTNDSDFQNTWMGRNEKLKLKHHAFAQTVPYSDFKVFATIMDHIKSGVVIHASNSTPIRYLQLFDRKGKVGFQANRGVSGIDGCSSTALGYALRSVEDNVLITGDMAFFYDSNAFWHAHKPQSLKIILINNGGGSIFRIIDGPSDTAQLETYFEARHETTAEHLASMYDMHYSFVREESELIKNVAQLLESKNPGISILEIFTPPAVNDQVLRDYFSFLKS